MNQSDLKEKIKEYLAELKPHVVKRILADPPYHVSFIDSLLMDDQHNDTPYAHIYDAIKSIRDGHKQ